MQCEGKPISSTTRNTDQYGAWGHETN